MNQRLRPFEADRLRAAPLTYDEVGATCGTLPDGYHHLSESFVIGHGRTAYDAAADALMSWGVQRGAGLRVASSSDRVELDAVAIVRLGWGPLGMRAPVRVVAVIDETSSRGFAYGTLAGHPERGEELFLVELGTNETVTLRITAFSRPGSLLAKLVGPAGKVVQRWITQRYGRALRS